MNYLKKNNKALINAKLTAIGRQKVATGQLNYKYYSFGDSQIDYAETPDFNILAPVDKQPNIKSYIIKPDCTPFSDVNADNFSVVECCYNNLAKERGFFNASNNNLLLDTKYFKKRGTVLSQQLNGTNFIDIGTTDFEDADFILFKIANTQTGYIVEADTTKPIVWLFFKIKKRGVSTSIEVDRVLPYLTYSNITIHYYIFDKDSTYFQQTNENVLWDYEQMEFNPGCLVEDTFVLNLNIVSDEDVIGLETNKYGYDKECSYPYIGSKHYFEYSKFCEQNTVVDCEDKLLSIFDNYKSRIGIIHINENIKNLQGEYYYIDANNKLTLKLPHILWHRRNYNTGLGVLSGMNFVSDTVKKSLPNTNIFYYDLIEDSTLINSAREPISVGKVFANQKIIVIDDLELLAALSYKSNRNYTLPALSGKMVSSDNGILPKNKVLYLTYTLQSNDGVLNILPCQRWTKFINNSQVAKNIEFALEDINLLPYMRQKELVGYDGFGFYAHKINVLYQIVDIGQRPSSNAWKSINYTNNFLTSLVGNTINPLSLENQNNSLTGFVINQAKIATATTYVISYAEIPDDTCPDKLNLGCETVLFGNLSTSIGACTYKSVFELTLDSDEYILSTNKSWNTNQEVILNEIGIYDDKYDLVIYASLSTPIKIKENSVSLIEMTLDF